MIHVLPVQYFRTLSSIVAEPAPVLPNDLVQDTCFPQENANSLHGAIIRDLALPIIRPTELVRRSRSFSRNRISKYQIMAKIIYVALCAWFTS